jgi:hypothetical protein
VHQEGSKKAARVQRVDSEASRQREISGGRKNKQTGDRNKDSKSRWKQEDGKRVNRYV